MHKRLKDRVFKKRTVLGCCLLSLISLVLLFMAVNDLGMAAPDGLKAESPPSAQAVPEPAKTESDSEKEVIAHPLPKEEAVPEERYTAHFKRSEMMCDCADACDGFPVAMDPAFMNRLEMLRQALGRPVIVTSGVRCETRNAEVGGIEGSWHLTGHAADIYCPGITYEQVAQADRDAGFGVVTYPEAQYCHVEYRE